MGRPKKVEFTVVVHDKDKFTIETCKNEKELMKLLARTTPEDLNKDVLVFPGQPLTVARHVSFSLNGTKRKPGRPPGSPNKPKVLAEAPKARKRGPGRPPGSKNKVKAIANGAKRGPGRKKAMNGVREVAAAA